jgi:hypothetical protein
MYFPQSLKYTAKYSLAHDLENAHSCSFHNNVYDFAIQVKIQIFGVYDYYFEALRFLKLDHKINLAVTRKS